MLECQAPADFHTRREMGVESRNLQSGKADEARDAGDLDRPQAKTVRTKMFFDVIHHGVALRAAQRTSEEFHDAGVGIHGGKCLPVRVMPPTQADAAAD